MTRTDWNTQREPTLTRSQAYKAQSLITSLLGPSTGYTVESHGDLCCLVVYINLAGKQSKFNFTIDDYTLLLGFKD